MGSEWARRLRLLLAFQAREGHCDVPQRHEEQGDKLGRWLATQRAAHKRGALETRREAALVAAGVAWDSIEARREAGWARRHGPLLAFKAREGHCEVPRRHEEEGDKSGQWLVDQRATHERGALEARRVQALEECGVRWSVRVPS